MGLNDAGTVVGRFTDAAGTHGFLATPTVPEPSTWSMMIAAFAALGFTRRRGAGGSR